MYKDQPIEINEDLLDGLHEMFADRPELCRAGAVLRGPATVRLPRCPSLPVAPL
jgi:hypothetical protein